MELSAKAPRLPPVPLEQHTVRFDFDEQVLALGITLFSTIVYDLAGRA